MFEWYPGNNIFDLGKYVSSVDNNEIEEPHEQDVEAIDEEDSQEILEENVYFTDSGRNRNEQDDDSCDNEKGSSEEEVKIDKEDNDQKDEQNENIQGQVPHEVRRIVDSYNEEFANNDDIEGITSDDEERESKNMSEKKNKL